MNPFLRNAICVLEAASLSACAPIAALVYSPGHPANPYPGPANPADPNMAVPVMPRQSVFDGYQPFQGQKSNSWRQDNKDVADKPGMGSMKDIPGKTMSEALERRTSPSMRHDSDSGTTVTTAQTDSDHAADAQATDLSATDVVRSLDKANAKVHMQRGAAYE